jgi:hypothetical protein
MTGTSERLSAKLLAAASVLGLSLGMATQSTDAEQLKGEQGQTSTQVKGQSDQHKLTSGFLKQNDHKLATGFLKQNDHKTGQDSNQLKWEGVSNQQKHTVPSSQLNPQPEPPKPAGGGSPQNQ